MRGDRPPVLLKSPTLPPAPRAGDDFGVFEQSAASGGERGSSANSASTLNISRKGVQMIYETICAQNGFLLCQTDAAGGDFYVRLRDTVRS